MHATKAQEVAQSDGEAIKKTATIGYAVNLVMDYGNGRQVTISGTLPLGASLEDMNAELDKLRLATNRQASLVTLRDVENTVAMAKKTVASLELVVENYTVELEKEMDRLKGSDTGKQTLVKQQIENMRQQALNYKMTKKEEIMREQSNIDKGTLMIDRLKQEIGEG